MFFKNIYDVVPFEYMFCSVGHYLSHLRDKKCHDFPTINYFSVVLFLLHMKISLCSIENARLFLSVWVGGCMDSPSPCHVLCACACSYFLNCPFECHHPDLLNIHVGLYGPVFSEIVPKVTCSMKMFNPVALLCYKFKT